MTKSHVIVASAMRTGSTWLVSMVGECMGIPDAYVTSVEEANERIRGSDPAVLKTHGIIDQDVEDVLPGVPIVRIVRNYKDSLVSRILYTRNIRPCEGLAIHEPEMRAFIDEMGELPDREFVARFVGECSLVHRWLGEIVMMERGDGDRRLTLMYESLMHNPFDAMIELIAALGPMDSPRPEEIARVVRNSLERGVRARQSFYRSANVGVGGWETWLDFAQAVELDELYFHYRAVAQRNLRSRWPFEGHAGILRPQRSWRGQE